VQELEQTVELAGQAAELARIVAERAWAVAVVPIVVALVQPTVVALVLPTVVALAQPIAFVVVVTTAAQVLSLVQLSLVLVSKHPV